MKIKKGRAGGATEPYELMVLSEALNYYSNYITSKLNSNKKR